MKTWIKGTLAAVIGAATLFGGIGVYAHNRIHEWSSMNPTDVAALKARMVERVGGKLDLDAAQKTRLATLIDAMQAQRAALFAGGASPHEEIQSLVAGATFDRAKASALLQQKVAAINAGSPAVITALGDFYDSLQPAQQAKVREFMAHRGHHRD